MVKVLYIARHAKAEGQEPEATLTSDGRAEAVRLAQAFATSGIDRIVTSTFRRAIESIEPLARHLGLPVETDERLNEANLSGINYPDWPLKLAATFDDDDLSYEGGESSRVATLRAKAAIESVLESPTRTPVVVTHGRLMTLLLRSYDRRFGFATWRDLSCPDLYKITLSESTRPEVVRVW